MADYEKRQLKALDRIAKKIADADSHLTKIEDSLDDKKHHTAQHETIKDIKSILKHARKVDKYEDKIIQREGEGRKGSIEDHYVYIEDEAPVIDDLKKEYEGLEKKLDQLDEVNGDKVEAFRAEHDYIEKSKEILKKAGKLK